MISDQVQRHSTAQMYTLDDFVHGRPERILHAAMQPKILLVWQHGNEELGPRVAHYIYTSRPDLAPHIDYLCGDPNGAATQSPAAVLGYDVNRGYAPATGPLSYAQGRAQEIMSVISAGKYDFVLDLHTSISELEQFFIVAHELTPRIKAAVAASAITKIVAMPRSVTEHALIGHASQAVAFEINEKFAETPEAVEEVAALLEVLLGKSQSKPLRREVFYVDRLISKAQDPGDSAENFVLCPEGYYPVLLGKGKHSYRNDPTKNYVCFGAGRKEEIII